MEIASAKPSTRSVDVDVAQQLGEAGGDDQREQARPPEGEHEAEAASDEREQQVLGQELPHQAPAPAGAGGGAQGELLLPRGARGQQQVRDVRAGDQQHEADRAQQEREHVRARRRSRPPAAGRRARPVLSGLLAARLEHLPAIAAASAWAAATADPRLQACRSTIIQARLRDLAEVVRGPEGDVVFPRHEAEAAAASRRSPCAARRRRGRTCRCTSLRAAEAPLPGLVGDDDRARFLLLDDVVEVLEPVRAAEERRDARRRDRPLHVDGHLLDARAFRPCPMSVTGVPSNWTPSERLERAARARSSGLDDLAVRRLLAGCRARGRCSRRTTSRSTSLKPELVVGDVVDDAVHRGGRSDAEAEREAGDDDHASDGASRAAGRSAGR